MDVADKKNSEPRMNADNHGFFLKKNRKKLGKVPTRSSIAKG